MIRLKDTQYPNTAAFLAAAIRIAEYYGFAALYSIPRAGRAPIGALGEPAAPKRTLMPLSEVESEISFARRDERSLLSAARKCLACAQRDGAVLAWRTLESTAGIPSISFELHVMGSSSAIAEALLIVVANAIAEESGVNERTLSINNIGSPDSSNRQTKRLLRWDFVSARQISWPAGCDSRK